MPQRHDTAITSTRLRRVVLVIESAHEDASNVVVLEAVRKSGAVSKV